MNEKIKKNMAAIVLIVGIALILIGSIAAQAFHTSGYSVSISRIKFDTEKGTLSGLLYMPDGAGPSSPRPTLVTTHGYLNSAEMQDAPAIEMSRRGYVVLALDMYDHGHSQSNRDNTGGFFGFWPTALWDAARYMYQQDYVLKDSGGNGIIAVSGHSMGGFSSSMALYYDEVNYQQSGIRMIYAGLSVGSDYSYTSFLGVDAAVAASMSGGRTVGKIAAHYDEFFFNAPGDVGTVNYKDYVATEEGQTFLETVRYDSEGNAALDPNVQANTWYSTSDGGRRIIYEPNETHPWNHFSKTTTSYMLSFYNEAFSGYQGNIKDIAPNSQIWMFKEAFELVALVGFVMCLMPLAALLIKLPFFKKAVTGEAAVLAPVSTLSGKVTAVSLFIVSMLIPAIIYPSVYEGIAEPLNWLGYAAIIALLLGAIALIMTAASKEEANKNGWYMASAVVILAGILMRYMATKGVPNNAIFKGPTVSLIVTWAVICACIGAVTMIAAYMLGGKREQGLACYGIKSSPSGVAASLCVAAIVSAAAFILVFAVDAIFKGDFRIWVFAFKSFEPAHILAALPYMPLFLIYYLAMGAAAVSNTASEKLQGIWGYVLAALTNMGGIAIWLILQYGILFASGSAFYPAAALDGILLIALVPTLAIASCFAKYLYKKTGNIYTAAFLNTILMTIMTVANTTIYYQR